MPIIEKWGTTLAVRIPEALVRSLGLGEGDQVALRAEGDGIAVSRKEFPSGLPKRPRHSRSRHRFGVLKLLAEADCYHRDETHDRQAAGDEDADTSGCYPGRGRRPS